MKIFYLLIISILFNINFLDAQCDPLVLNSISTTGADCPSSGSATVNASGTSLNYKLTAGPIGYPTSTNSTGIFNSLTAGVYTVEVTDGCGVVKTSNFTITDLYPTYTAETATVVPGTLCGDFIEGADLNGTVTGGKSTYQYDFVKLVGGVPVSAPVYSAPSSSMSYNETVTEFGIYRFYALDACGEVRTKDVSVLATMPTPTTITNYTTFYFVNCVDQLDGLPIASYFLQLKDSNGNSILWNNIPGTTVDVYKTTTTNPFTSNMVNCTSPLGSLIVSYVPNVVGSNYTLIVPQEDVIVVITTPCGSKIQYCLNFNPIPLPIISDLKVIQTSCVDGIWNNQLVTQNATFTNSATPINWELTKANGSMINQTSSTIYTSFLNLKPSDYPVTIIANDACQRADTVIVNFPFTEGGPSSSTFFGQTSHICSSVEGTVSVALNDLIVNLAGLASSTYTITGGPIWAEPNLSLHVSGNLYYASNLVPGYTYTITWTNTCGQSANYIFTVPVNGYNGILPISWNTTAIVDALCGQNKGNIVANANLNTSSLNPVYCLYDAITNMQVGSCNSTGLFSNIPPGDYKVKWEYIHNYPCSDKSFKDSVFVSVLGDGVAQSIIRKTILL